MRHVLQRLLGPSLISSDHFEPSRQWLMWLGGEGWVVLHTFEDNDIVYLFKKTEVEAGCDNPHNILTIEELEAMLP